MLKHKKIRKLRKRANENQSELADYLNVSIRTMHNYENGDTVIPSDKLYDISVKYDVELGYFFKSKKQ